jgi:hypothetical protein
MSWSIPTQTIDPSETPTGISEQVAGLNATPQQDGFGGADESQAAIEHARSVIGLLIVSGAYGDYKTHRFTVYANGHSNVGCEPDAAWTNDYVSLSITQAKADA